MNRVSSGTGAPVASTLLSLPLRLTAVGRSPLSNALPLLLLISVRAITRPRHWLSRSHLCSAKTFIASRPIRSVSDLDTAGKYLEARKPDRGQPNYCHERSRDQPRTPSSSPIRIEAASRKEIRCNSSNRDRQCSGTHSSVYYYSITP